MVKSKDQGHKKHIPQPPFVCIFALSQALEYQIPHVPT